MSPDDQRRTGSLLHVAITDGLGRPLRRPALARWLRAVAPSRARGEVALALVGDGAMRRLNRDFGGRDAVTDVLSFGGDERARAGGQATHLGDIVIATGVAARQAADAGHPLGTEMRILALHGLLHLLGYDHTRDNGTMARLERRLRRNGGLREGLIERRAVPHRRSRR